MAVSHTYKAGLPFEIINFQGNIHLLVKAAALWIFHQLADEESSHTAALIVGVASNWHLFVLGVFFPPIHYIQYNKTSQQTWSGID